MDLTQRIARAHSAAQAAGEPMYVDPMSGFLVMTSDYLGELGVCCDRGCRHCPYVARDADGPQPLADESA